MLFLLYAAITGSALWLTTEILEMTSPGGATPLSLWMTALWHPIIAAGYWGLHSSQSSGENLLSLIGVLLLTVAFLAFAPVSLIILKKSISSFDVFMEQYPVYQVFGGISLIGNVLFSISVLRTRYYQGWVGYALIAALIVSVIQVFAHLPEIWQHVAFLATALILIHMALFAMRQPRDTR